MTQEMLIHQSRLVDWQVERGIRRMVIVWRFLPELAVTLVTLSTN